MNFEFIAPNLSIVGFRYNDCDVENFTYIALSSENN